MIYRRNLIPGLTSLKEGLQRRCLDTTVTSTGN